ncbi:hypothetical protein [Streptomyces sp. NPDC058869]|uniref:hypothetical protein n=1 Tax=Streptomyces sp. NPDC058869 TaxID=3346659 RepID=UPI0036A95F02
MPNKITFIASSVASAATAFGIGALVFASPNAPERAVPELTPPAAATPDTAPSAETRAPSSPATPSTAPPVGRHAKPTTEPEKPAQAAPTGKHAKPTTKATTEPAEPGSRGPLKDAEGDGKVLDDIGNILMPSLPEVPDEWLPFPDAEGNPGNEAPDAEVGNPDWEYPYDPNWGDSPEDAADPGIVCDEELAEYLGVELSPTCARDDNGDSGTWDVPGGTWGAFTVL